MGNGDHMTDKKELAKFVKDLINQNQELIVEKHELEQENERLKDNQYNCQHCMKPLNATKYLGVYECPNCLKIYPHKGDTLKDLELELNNCRLGIEDLKAKIVDMNRIREMDERIKMDNACLIQSLDYKLAEHHKIAKEIMAFKMEHEITEHFGMIDWDDIKRHFNLYSTAIRGMVKQILNEPSKDECKSQIGRWCSWLSNMNKKNLKCITKLKYDLEKVRRRLQKSNEKLRDHTLCQIRYGPPYNKISELENEIKEWVDSDAKLLKVIYSKNKYIEELKQERKSVLQQLKTKTAEHDMMVYLYEEEKKQLAHYQEFYIIIKKRVFGYSDLSWIKNKLEQFESKQPDEKRKVTDEHYRDLNKPIPVKEGADIPPMAIPCPACKIPMIKIAKGTADNFDHWTCPTCRGDFWQP